MLGMARDIRNKQFIYHLTSLENLEAIFENGIMPRNMLYEFDDVAHPDIIIFREEHNLNDYVPFHFFAKNPFDGRVQIDHPDKTFVYICLKRSFASQQNFRIIPMHPIAMGEELVLYEYDEGMENIDWDTMEKTDYQETYCKNVCMAECLSNRVIEPFEFCAIYVKDENTKNQVEQMAQMLLGRIPFRVNKNENMFVR